MEAVSWKIFPLLLSDKIGYVISKVKRRLSFYFCHQPGTDACVNRIGKDRALANHMTWAFGSFIFLNSMRPGREGHELSRKDLHWGGKMDVFVSD